MSDYDYANGEEAMEGIDSEFSDIADEAFSKVDKDLQEGVITWSNLCREYFGMEEPPRDEKAQWALHVMARSAMLGAVNHRARIYHKSWQLFIEKAGVSVVKSARSNMVGRMIHQRMKRVAGACKLITTRLTPLSINMELTPKDRKLVRQMLDISRGSQMAIAGMVDRLDAVKKNDKMELLSLFEIDYNDED